MLFLLHQLVLMPFLVGSDFINLSTTAIAFIFSHVLSTFCNWHTFLIGSFGMWGLRLTSNIIARWSDTPDIVCMFSMRFGEVVIRRSGTLFEVGLVAWEMRSERELSKRKSRSTSYLALLVQPVFNVSQSMPGRLIAPPIIILVDDLLWRVII